MGKWRRQDRLPALKSPSPFWSKDRHSDRRPRLQLRQFRRTLSFPQLTHPQSNGTGRNQHYLDTLVGAQ